MKLRIPEPALIITSLLLLGGLFYADQFAMAEMNVITLNMLLVVAVLAYGALLWSSRPKDERESSLVLSANNHALVAGAVVLVIGIIYETLSHGSAVWLIVALAVMAIARLLSYYKNRKQQE